ncbi:hypothetical protein Prum_094740 [Phytohabitans rumicis]|uniref:Lipoyl-binding domain-containing protein n=1 Tax=Phytohabitans rumicis TaxID=1076125 RepID=A0A6V8LF12_9ACTN|nr:hypothetical protein Prum_094740 [Phytohabitans rumicis]
MTRQEQPTLTATLTHSERRSDVTVFVTVPALGEHVVEGTVTRWLKHVGDTVEAGEPLFEISTDKVDTEIPAEASGTLLEIKVLEGETAPVGAAIAAIKPVRK